MPSVRVSWVCVTVIVGSVMACASASPDASAGRKNEEIQRLAEWVRKTGSETVIRSHIADALGLPNHDAPVWQRALQVRGDRLTYVFALIRRPASEDIFIFGLTDEADGAALLWRSSRHGELERAIHFTGSAIETMATREALLGFGDVKAFFIAKMRADG